MSQSIASAISWARQQGMSGEVLYEAKWLLVALLDCPESKLITHPETLLTEHQWERYQAQVKQRLSGYPLAYILGYRDFYNHRFIVTPDVLIPRADTEVLVEAVLAQITAPKAQGLDLATGSGIIGCSLAAEQPQWQLMATDICPKAIAVAKANAKAIGLENIQFAQGSWFEAVAGQTIEPFDFIVSNPPYLAENDPHLLEGDLRFEPQKALHCELSGMAAYTAILENAKAYLKPSGWIFLEHGFEQSILVSKLLDKNGFVAVRTINDYSHLPRVTIAQLG